MEGPIVPCRPTLAENTVAIGFVSAINVDLQEILDRYRVLTVES